VTGSRRVFGAGLVALAVAVLACDALLGLKDPVEGSLDAFASPVDAGDGGDRDASGDAPSFPEAAPEAAIACPAGLTLCTGTCVALSQDPANCGTCGHDCFGSCQAALCQTSSIPVNEPVRSIAFSLQTLYLLTDDRVLASQLLLDDAGGGSFAPPVPLLALDGGVTRAFAGGTSGTYAPGAAVAVAPGDTLLEVTAPSGTPATIAVDAGDPVSMAAYGSTIYWASSDPAAPAIMSYTPPGPLAAFAPLVPGDRPCSLAASQAGVFWTSARGTWLAPGNGSAPVSVRPNAFDRAIVGGEGVQVFIAGSDDVLGLYAVGEPAPLLTLFLGPVDALAFFSPGVVYASQGGLYGVLLEGNAVSPALLLATATVPTDCHVTPLAIAYPFLVWVDADTGQVQYVSVSLGLPGGVPLGQ